MRRKIILTLDLEFWYSGKFLRRYAPKDENNLNDFIRESTGPILNLLNQRHQKATFFVLGKLAEKYPLVIKDIFDNGHEIASHGYSHQPVNKLAPEEFENEIIKTNRAVYDIIGQRPIGFRAPNFSIGKKNQWTFNILKKQGFRYDSSIHPLSINKLRPSIRELPATLGGFYFRLLPFNVFTFLTQKNKKTKIPIIYLHPHELFASCPKIKSAPWLKRTIKYWGTENAWQKFEKLVENFQLISIKDYLNENFIR